LRSGVTGTCSYVINTENAVSFGLKVHQQSMTQDRQCDRAKVLVRDDAAAFEERARLSAKQQRLPRSRSRTPPDPLGDPLRYVFGVRPCASRSSL
jgi:hypothetical protein